MNILQADNQAANLDSPLHLAAVNGERLELDAFLKTGIEEH